jgi:chromate reductase, NAD(P)H dehydrogenase (quinone)
VYTFIKRTIVHFADQWRGFHMSQTLHILGFSGSLRAGSYNTRLLHLAAEKLPPDMQLEIFNLAPIPFYNGDVEAAGYPEVVAAFRGKINAADGLLIACPEYNYSVTGVLKNALDWASRTEKGQSGPPLFGKPLAMMGVGGRFGTVRAQMHLRQIAAALDMKDVQKPEIYISNIPNRAFDEAGQLNDPKAHQLIADLLLALQNMIHKHQGS